jgi:predicted site-specific integrase-resolvase
MNKFKSAMIDYRTHKRNLVASEQDKPIEYILAKLNDKVSFGLDRIKRDCKVYNTLIKRLETAETNQKDIDENLDILTGINGRIYEKLGSMKNTEPG